QKLIGNCSGCHGAGCVDGRVGLVWASRFAAMHDIKNDTTVIRFDVHSCRMIELCINLLRVATGTGRPSTCAPREALVALATGFTCTAAKDEPHYLLTSRSSMILTTRA